MSDAHRGPEGLSRTDTGGIVPRSTWLARRGLHLLDPQRATEDAASWPTEDDTLEYFLEGEQGDAVAQSLLGLMYDEGLGLPQDSVQAALWYRRAAEQGDLISQQSLAWKYLHGDGVPQDYAQAALWFRKPA